MLSTASDSTKKIKELLLSEDVYDYCAGYELLNNYFWDGGHTFFYNTMIGLDTDYGNKVSEKFASLTGLEDAMNYRAINDNAYYSANSAYTALTKMCETADTYEEFNYSIYAVKGDTAVFSFMEYSKKKKRVSMSFGTAVSLSLNNLLTKKGRTILTAFAGSIGIIGIALILALSTGINELIDDIQEETLSSYPLEIMRENTDTSGMIEALMNKQEEYNSREFRDDTVYANTQVYDMFNSFNASAKQINNMKDFKTFLDNDSVIKDKSNAISYGYDLTREFYYNIH